MQWVFVFTLYRYCPSCKTDCSEVINAGEKMRLSKKKAGMTSNKQGCNRDWGKGMACVGRTKQCTIVPSNHFGPIPGVPVGSLWKFRVQVGDMSTYLYITCMYYIIVYNICSFII